MTWDSEEGRALLWRAFPDGILEVRGVRTITGWQVVFSDDVRARIIPPAIPILDPTATGDHPGRVSAETVLRHLRAGDLLPDPDPTDVATWACLKAELAQWLGWPRDDDGCGLIFSGDEGTGHWALRGEKHTRREHAFPEIDTGEPAEALIRSLIYAREVDGAFKRR